MPMTEGFGRNYVVLPTASGVAINMRDYSSVEFWGTNDNTFTLTLATSFGGSYIQPSGWNPITHYYQNTDNGVGTGVFTKQTQAASNVVTQGSDNTTVIILLQSEVPDTYTYVKCTSSAPGDGSLVAVCIPLVQRGPANLAKLSA